MPPKQTKKRKNDSLDNDERPAKRAGYASTTEANPVPHTVKSGRKSTREINDIVKSINETIGDSSDSSSSDESFEDVPIIGHEDEDEEMDWEDALGSEAQTESSTARVPPKVISDISFTFKEPSAIPDYSILKNGKKGPSKKDRAVRIDTHGMHVLALTWHNTTRNAWCNDSQVHEYLIKDLSEGLKAEIERWRVASGLTSGKPSTPSSGKKKKGKSKKEKKSRDWSSEAERQEKGIPDMSAGDPLIRLLKHLSAYWKKRFEITAPGLRKRGFKSVIELSQEMKAWAQDPDNSTRFGERIQNLEAFREAAKKHAGSRDLSAQLFTALLRAIGIESRLVASLQPAGFGWSKAEDAKSQKNLIDSANVSATASSTSNIATGGSTSRNFTKQPIIVDTSTSELSDIASDSDVSMPLIAVNAVTKKRAFDKDLPFPIYWTEVLSPVTNTHYAVSMQLTPHVAIDSEGFEKYEPRGSAAERAKQVICYVIAYSADGTGKDVTVRYLKRRQLPGKTKGFRLPAEKVPVYNKRGTKIVKFVESDWIKRVLRFYARPGSKRTTADEIEDEGDLIPLQPMRKEKEVGSMPESLQAFKASTEFVLERHLRRGEAIVHSAKPIKDFTYGKGEKEKTEAVYRRKDVVSCKTVESWHKEGREVKIGSQPLKLVPIRAVTLIRKQEVEHATRETGEKPLQGLYSRDQTQWIIPPPIKNGHIPKNTYGNIDIYVPSMVPKGAVHIPLRGTVKVCKKLGIDYAEACTGFEFGHQMAVPIITGVVVAEEHEDAVIDGWEEEEEKKRRREDEKQEKKILGLWRKFAMGIKIMERVQEDYGADDLPDEINPFIQFKKNDKHVPHQQEIKKIETLEEDNKDDFEGHIEEHGGGFLPEGMDVLEPRVTHLEIDMGSHQMHTNREIDTGTDDEHQAPTKKSNTGPRSLRTAYLGPVIEDNRTTDGDEALSEAEEDESEDQSNDDIDLEEGNESDSEDSDLSDQEYAGFTKTSLKKLHISTTRATRKAATQSPYFKKKR